MLRGKVALRRRKFVNRSSMAYIIAKPWANGQEETIILGKWKCEPTLLALCEGCGGGVHPGNYYCYASKYASWLASAGACEHQATLEIVIKLPRVALRVQFK